MNFFKHKIWVEGLCSFCNEILTFFFFAKLWKLFFMVKSGTDARRHLVLEWSNPISRHFPTSGREPRQVLSSNSTHSQTKKIIIYVKSPRDVLHAVMWAKQSLLIRLWKKKKKKVPAKRDLSWHGETCRTQSVTADWGKMWKCSPVPMCKFIRPLSWRVLDLCEFRKRWKMCWLRCFCVMFAVML